MGAVEKSLNELDINRLMRRGVAEVVIEEEMIEMLRSGRELRLKEGFDPSFPDIHLGHMVALRKLRQFQELGHQVVLIVADWTARIGDPSGVSATRPMLSLEQVRSNAQTYMDQFFKIMDRDRTEVRWQSEWFDAFGLEDIIRLASRFTVAQFLARDDFSKRYNEGRPIAITEFLYPLLQAYDSVMVQADVEFGGTDQKFNFLVGREMQAMMGQRPQQCFMTPLLVGTDGSQKMSKSLGNYIGVTESPEDIYGKVMSISDDLILVYFELVTDVPDEEQKEFRLQLDKGTLNPMVLKKRLGRELVSQLYDRKAAAEAEKHFEKVVQKKEAPEEIEEFSFSFKDIAVPMAENVIDAQKTGMKIIQSDDWDVSRIIVHTGQAKSRSEANRLIKQGAVGIDGEKISGNVAPVKSGSIIQVGKRRFIKVINTDRGV